MLALLAIFATSFVIALSGALMPGPLLTATIGESSRRGLLAGPLLSNDSVFAAIALAGAAILFRIAWGMFRSLPSLRLAWGVDESRRGNLALSGVLLSVANPYWTVWWATIGLGYILQCRQYGMWGIAAFFLGHILADLAWYSVVSTAVDKGRRFLNDRMYKGLMGACAGFLVVFAGWFLYAGVEKLAG